VQAAKLLACVRRRVPLHGLRSRGGHLAPRSLSPRRPSTRLRAPRATSRGGKRSGGRPRPRDARVAPVRTGRSTSRIPPAASRFHDFAVGMARKLRCARRPPPWSPRDSLSAEARSAKADEGPRPRTQARASPAALVPCRWGFDRLKRPHRVHLANRSKHAVGSLENASQRGFRGGLRPASSGIELPRCHSSPACDARITLTAALPVVLRAETHFPACGAGSRGGHDEAALNQSKT
jgi:hypothetical protein